MPTLQELTHVQVEEALRSAVEKQVPAVATIRSGGGWMNLHTRFLACRGPHLLMSMPSAEGDIGPRSFAPADKIGVSFKLKHHKHVFTAVVAASESYLDGDTVLPALRLCCPTKMQRLQRRAFLRVNVPPNRIVRGSFWLGGREAEPAGTTVECPVWQGRVTNLSAGGFQLLTSPECVSLLEVGDLVGVRLVFGAGQEAVYADAQYRHVEPQDCEALLGFQFLGLPLTPEGRETLDALSARVAEFQRIEEAAERRAV